MQKKKENYKRNFDADKDDVNLEGKTLITESKDN
jgi:hypothetical protein